MMENHHLNPDSPKRWPGTLIAFWLIVTISIATCYFVIITSPSNLTPPRVRTKYGMVEGDENVLMGQKVQTFRGVPFAKPPIGKLRLQRPKELLPWKGVLKADRFQAGCVEHHEPEDIWVPDSEQSDDCLYLNIYVPGVAKRDRNLTVVSWIHGGGFRTDNLKFVNQAKLAAFGDVIIVSIAYRLGHLVVESENSITNNSREVLVNLGHLDQQMALNWIRENIAEFGGNPKDLMFVITRPTFDSLPWSPLLGNNKV